MSTQRIGKYEVVEEIGTGAYGRVYLARDPVIDRPVTLKLCTSTDPAVRERFLQEAQLAGMLDHPSIVTVYDYGEADEGPFLVQEYVDGEALAEVIARVAAAEAGDGETVPDGRRLAILRSLAEALEHAHLQGVLHRDVRPSHIHVLPDDRVKLSDFGIARLFGAETQLTELGAVADSAGYLAPEQAGGGEVTAGTDVFSFGVVAYELLSGRHPFPGDELSEVLEAILAASPTPLTELRPNLPPTVLDVVRRCLRGDPEGRPRSFSEILHDLHASAATSNLSRTAFGLHATDALPGRGEAAVPAHTRVLPPPPPVPTRPREDDPDPSLHDTAAIPAPPAAPAPTRAVPTAPTARTPRPRGRAASTAPPARPGRAVAAAPRRVPRLAAAVAVAVVLLGALAWWWLARGGDDGPAAPGTARGGSDDPVATVPVAPGELRVETRPWARVTRVTGPEGEVELPEDASTPLSLSLPPGAYEVELSHPDLADPVSCRVMVAGEAGEPAGNGCPEQLVSVGPLEYFREVGWWR